jgi:hypothetical protein
LDRGAAEGVGLQEELGDVGTGRHAGKVAAEQGAGIHVAVALQAAEVGHRRGGDRLLAVAGIGDVAGQRQPVALGHLSGELLRGEPRWRCDRQAPGIGALQLEGERGLRVGQLVPPAGDTLSKSAGLPLFSARSRVR